MAEYDYIVVGAGTAGCVLAARLSEDAAVDVLLLEAFRRSERAAGGDPALRGTDGPVRVAPVPAAARHPVATAFAAALGALGVPTTADVSGASQEGVAWVDLAIDGGERVSAADAYLGPALSRPNLTVQTGCLVTGLLVQRGACRGVSYAVNGTPGDARASTEVILCAGAVGAAAVDAVGTWPGCAPSPTGYRPSCRSTRGR